MKYHWTYENKRFSYLRKDLIDAKKEQFVYNNQWHVARLQSILATTNISSLRDTPEADDLIYLLNEFRPVTNTIGKEFTEYNSTFFLEFICTGLLGTNRTHCRRWWQSNEPNGAQPIHSNVSEKLWHIIRELHRRKCPVNDICSLDVGQRTIQLLVQICNNLPRPKLRNVLETCGVIIQDIIKVRFEITRGVVDIRLADGFHDDTIQAFMDIKNNANLCGMEVVENLRLYAFPVT